MSFETETGLSSKAQIELLAPPAQGVDTLTKTEIFVVVVMVVEVRYVDELIFYQQFVS